MSEFDIETGGSVGVASVPDASIGGREASIVVPELDRVRLQELRVAVAMACRRVTLANAAVRAAKVEVDKAREDQQRAVASLSEFAFDGMPDEAWDVR